MTILLVEDEEIILNGVSDIIKGMTDFSCKLYKVKSGPEGLKISEKVHPNLIITDILMPEMTGLDFIEIAQRKNLCKNYVILSGHDQFSFAQRAIRYNVIDYLLKPIDKEQLHKDIVKVHNTLPQEGRQQSDTILPNIAYFRQKVNNTNYPTSLKMVISYINDNYTKDISLQLISNDLMLHPSYISSLINNYLGISFTNYLDFLRIKKAAILLINSPNIPVSEISFMSGYSNERRLYNAFQKHLQMTPGDFRNKYMVTTDAEEK